jgi:hypothetical protein
MGSKLGQMIVEVFLTIVVCLTTTVFSIATKNWTSFFNRQVFGRALGRNECLIQWMRECHMNGWMLSRHLQDLTQRCLLTAFAGLVELWIYTEKRWNLDWNSPNLLTGRQFRQVYININININKNMNININSYKQLYMYINFIQTASPIASLQTLMAPKAATAPISNTYRM